MAYQTVVVGTDGSDSSLRAVERAGRIAAESGARLVIATAYLHRRKDPHEVDLLKEEGYIVLGDAPVYAILRAAHDRAKAVGAKNKTSGRSLVRPSRRWWSWPRKSMPTCWSWATWD